MRLTRGWKLIGPMEAADGGWLPMLVLYRAYPEMDALMTRDAETSEERPAILMQPGRGDGVAAYGSHYGSQFIAHMRPAYLDEIVRANLTRRSG